MPEERKNEKVELVIFSDSDYSGDKSNRRSVTGFVVFLMVHPSLGNQKDKIQSLYQAQRQNILQFLRQYERENLLQNP